MGEGGGEMIQRVVEITILPVIGVDGEVGERRGEVIHRVWKAVDEGEVGEGGWKVVHWVIKGKAAVEVGKSGRKVINCKK
jgi:hypothetical protein